MATLGNLRTSALLQSCVFALCMGGCSNQGEEPGGDAAESSENAAGEDGDSEDSDAKDIIALLDPDDFQARCEALGKSIMAKHGIQADQKVVNCDDGVGLDEMDVLEPKETCDALKDEIEDWNCSMTFDQLAWCFEGAPECSAGKFRTCAYRAEMCKSGGSATKDEKALKQGSTLLGSMPSSKLKADCESLLSAELKDKGLRAGETYQCESSSAKVEVLDPAETCEILSGLSELKGELCDLRLGDVMGCFSVEAECDPGLEELCGLLISGCAGEEDDQ